MTSSPVRIMTRKQVLDDKSSLGVFIGCTTFADAKQLIAHHNAHCEAAVALRQLVLNMETPRSRKASDAWQNALKVVYKFETRIVDILQK